MTKFVIDERLERDSVNLGMLGHSSLLLMNNALVPWFILVPHTQEIEIVDMPEAEQLALLKEINLLSHFIKNNYQITKLNTAAIGNIVSQLHVHVVGRNPSDYCWPNVVWGTQEKEPYNTEEIESIRTKLVGQLGEQFSVSPD